MDLSQIPILQAMTKRMAWLGERQAVLAQNVANADTPKYTAKDLKPLDFSTLVAGVSQKLRLATTQPGHLTPVSAVGAFKQADQKVGERAPDGNGVLLEEQMMKISDTNNDFALTSSLYRQQLGLLKLVLGHGTTG